MWRGRPRNVCERSTTSTGASITTLYAEDDDSVGESANDEANASRSGDFEIFCGDCGGLGIVADPTLEENTPPVACSVWMVKRSLVLRMKGFKMGTKMVPNTL